MRWTTAWEAIGMRSRQYRYLDLLKVVAMTFVCMYHFWYGGRRGAEGFSGFVMTYLYAILSTCVPLFFAVNGALLLNRENFDANKHLKKLLTIFVQYCVWHGITSVILGIRAGVDFFALHKHELLNIFLLLETPEGVDLNHLWFVPTLCGVYVLYPFLRLAFEREREDRNARLALLCLLGIGYFLCFCIRDLSIFKDVSPYLTNLNLDQFHSFNLFGMRIGTMLPYFLLGGFLHKYREYSRKIPTGICVLMVLAGLLLSYGIVAVKTWQGDPGYDIVFEGYGSTGTLLCTAGIFLLASRLEEKIPAKGILLSVMQAISRNTMTIYYTHWILGYALLPMLGIPYGGFGNLLKTGLMVACGTLLGEVLKRIPVVKYLIH